ncbi:MAG: CAP domain-containing protein [Mycobacterium sp.]|uniref:CAP domain-containing protein n=1 Tax=Mycobacterium sp. TaxID=1785 RepID=UPI001EC398D0|nr:CAP domain-containing protein [Mycobacterium sp.]MBV8786993.1 CAP domain-containing protein [Mycobacterium sp.]
MDADRAAATLSPAEAENEVLCLINKQRANHGLNALTANPILGQVAAAHATASVTLKWWPPSGGHSVHINPQTGMDAAARIREAGYCPMNRDNVPRGENVYAGQYSGTPPPAVMAKTTSPEAAVNGWMNSPGHRANILNPAYRESGIAVLRGVPISGAPAGQDGYVFVQSFGGCAI